MGAEGVVESGGSRGCSGEWWEQGVWWRVMGAEGVVESGGSRGCSGE